MHVPDISSPIFFFRWRHQTHEQLVGICAARSFPQTDADEWNKSTEWNSETRYDDLCGPHFR